MEQLDKEVIDKLSEPAKRVFRSLDYRSQRRMLKKAKEMGKQKKRKTQQKERVKKKSITKRQKKKEQAKERGSSTKRNQSRTASFVGTEIKDTSAQILQSMLLGTTMSEETYESNSEKQADMTAGKVSAEVTQKSMQGAKHGVRSLYRKRQQKKMQKQAAKKSAQSTKQGIKSASKAIQQVGKIMTSIVQSVAANPVVWIVLLIVLLMAVIVGAIGLNPVVSTSNALLLSEGTSSEPVSSPKTAAPVTGDILIAGPVAVFAGISASFRKAFWVTTLLAIAPAKIITISRSMAAMAMVCFPSPLSLRYQ